MAQFRSENAILFIALNTLTKHDTITQRRTYLTIARLAIAP